MPSRSTAKVTSTSAKTSTAGASSDSFTREWASLPARLFLLRNRSIASWRGGGAADRGGRSGRGIMRLTDEEEAMRAGDHGPALQWAIDHQIRVGRYLGAADFVPGGAGP